MYTALISLLGAFDGILGCRFVCDGVLLVYVVQKQEMAGEAKAARMYRDEIETLKVQVQKHLMDTCLVTTHVSYVFMFPNIPLPCLPCHRPTQFPLLSSYIVHVHSPYIFSTSLSPPPPPPPPQSAKVEKLEADVKKYRQKAEDTEYLRKRIAVSRCLLCLCPFVSPAVHPCWLALALPFDIPVLFCCMSV